MEEGTLINWLVRIGDAVREGDEIVELESSKIVNVLQAHASGTLRRQLAKEGDTLPVGALLGVLADPAVPDQDIDAFVRNFKPSATVVSTGPAPATAAAAVSSKTSAPSGGGTGGIPQKLKQGGDDSALPASPHARRFAKQHGINLVNVTGSGRGGRIQIEDIEKAVIAAGGTLPGATAPAPAAAAFTEALMTGMRQTIARRIKDSKLDAPHYRLVRDVAVDALMKLRERINGARPGAAITLNDLLIKACASALVQTPACNIQFDGQTIRRYRNADIAIAVALDSGLITPIVQAANLKTVAEIAAAARDLVARAKSGALKAADYSGGSFTISNLGMYGVRQFDAIINRPQAAILAVGAAEERVVVRNGAPAVARMLTLTLSCDHRVIDGAAGAGFLETLAELIEKPDALAA